MAPLVNISEMNMKNTIEDSIRVQESEIREAAYQMWEKAGRPAGRDLEFWLKAEAQLRTATEVASTKAVTPLSPVASKNNGVPKAAQVRLEPRRRNAAKVQQKVRRF